MDNLMGATKLMEALGNYPNYVMMSCLTKRHDLGVMIVGDRNTTGDFMNVVLERNILESKILTLQEHGLSMTLRVSEKHSNSTEEFEQFLHKTNLTDYNVCFAMMCAPQRRYSKLLCDVLSQISDSVPIVPILQRGQFLQPVEHQMLTKTIQKQFDAYNIRILQFSEYPWIKNMFWEKYPLIVPFSSTKIQTYSYGVETLFSHSYDLRLILEILITKYHVILKKDKEIHLEASLKNSIPFRQSIAESDNIVEYQNIVIQELQERLNSASK